MQDLKLTTCLTFSFILILNTYQFAQKRVEMNNVSIRKGSTLVNLKQFNEFSVIYHKTSREMDSISTEVYCREIRSKKDTLYLKPTDVTTFRLMDSLRPYSESRYYPETSTTWIKVPGNEIEYIKAKKQPLNKITGTILSLSYVTLICSPFIAMSQNAQVSNFGVGLFLVSVPVMAVSLSTNLIWSKRKYRFDRNRTHKDVWEFDK